MYLFVRFFTFFISVYDIVTVLIGKNFFRQVFLIILLIFVDFTKMLAENFLIWWYEMQINNNANHLVVIFLLYL